MRMDDGNAGASVGKAMGSFNGELLEIFGCPVTW